MRKNLTKTLAISMAAAVMMTSVPVSATNIEDNEVGTEESKDENKAETEESTEGIEEGSSKKEEDSNKKEEESNKKEEDKSEDKDKTETDESSESETDESSESEKSETDESSESEKSEGVDEKETEEEDSNKEEEKTEEETGEEEKEAKETEEQTQDLTDNAATASDTYITIASGTELNTKMKDVIASVLITQSERARAEAEVALREKLSLGEGESIPEDKIGLLPNIITREEAIEQCKYIYWASNPSVYDYTNKNDDYDLVPIERDENVIYTDTDGYKLYAKLVRSPKQRLDEPVYNTLYLKADRASIKFENGDASNLFRGFNGVEAITLLDKLYVQEYTNTSGMFDGCRKLGQLSLPNTFDTSNTTNMSNMFRNCGAKGFTLTNLSVLNTSKVTNFSGMFDGCTISDTLDIMNFDGKSAVDCSRMFANMKTLKRVAWDRDKFTCEKVDNFREMFSGDDLLEVIDFGGISCKAGADITSILDECKMLKAINTFKVNPAMAVEMPFSGTKHTMQDIFTTKYTKIGGDSSEAPSESTWIGYNILKISFDALEGQQDEDSSMDDQLFIDGATISLTENTLKYKGYTLKGWTDVRGSKSVKYVPGGTVSFNVNTKLYAIWDRTTFNMTFHHEYDSDGDQISDTDVIEMENGGTLVTVPTCKRAGFDVKWYTRNSLGKPDKEIKAGDVINITKDMDVYAYYIGQSYNIIYEPNGGLGAMQVQTVGNAVASYLDRNLFVRDGYTFIGWSKVKNVDTAITVLNSVALYDRAEVTDLYTGAAQEVQDIKLYALWLKDGTKGVSNITMDLNGGTIPTGVRYKYSNTNTNTIPLGQPVRNDAEFVGWSGDGIKTVEKEYEIPAKSTGDKSYTAHWSDEKYTVTFEANDAEFTTAQTVFGGTVEVPSAEPTKENSTFQGWYTEKGMKYDFSTPVTTNTTLKAKFSPITNKSGMENDFIMTQGAVNMVKGQSYILPHEKGYKWKTSDKKYVTVSSKGVVKAVKAGTSVITDGAGHEYKITVYDPKLDRKSVQLGVGEHTTLSLIDAPEEYITSWVSSNPAVADVINGEVYAIGTGSAKITAYMNGRSYACTVKVVSLNTKTTAYDDVQDITLYINQGVKPKYSDKAFKLDASKTTVKLLVNGKDTTRRNSVVQNGKFVYTYSNEYVKITPDFKITGLSEGDVVVEMVYNGKVKKTINLSVKALVNKREVYINEGKAYTISTPGVSATKITWESLHPEVATVKKNKVTGVAGGNTVIKGIYEVDDVVKGRYEFNVHVTTPGLNVDEFMVAQPKKKNAYSMTLPIGTSYTVLPTGTNQSIVWKSSNSKVASVDNYGVIRTKAKGKANISASINGQTVIIAVKVVPEGEAQAVPESNDFTYKTINIANGQMKAHLTRSGRVYVDYKGN